MNSPVNFKDPAGHMCSDPEDTKNGSYNGHCEGIANVKTKIGNKMIAGDGKTPGLGSCGGFGQKKCRTSKEAETKIVSTDEPETWIGPSEQEDPLVSPNYEDWYYGGLNDPVRNPDYVTLTPTVSLPGLGLLVNLSFPITLDRFGNVYFGVGVSFGPKGYAIGGAGSLVGGYVLDGPPGEARMERYLSGPGFNIGGGFIIGGAYNTSLSDINLDQSIEGGIYLLNPQFAGTLYYSGIVYDNSTGNPIWR